MKLRVDTNVGGGSNGIEPRDPNVFLHGVTKVQGMRPHQQDRHRVFHATNEAGSHLCSFYCVFDGHGGHRASDYCVDHLCENIIDSIGKGPLPTVSAIRTALRVGFLKTDRDFMAAERRRQGGRVKNTGREGGINAAACASLDGTTAVVLLSWPAHRRIFVAHVGDSRAVLARVQKHATAVPLAPFPGSMPRISRGAATTFSVVQLTREHKPMDCFEALRIRRAGGAVIEGRVQGILAMSRAIGNAILKPLISPEPDIIEFAAGIRSDASDNARVRGVLRYSIAILGTDGLWDVVSNGQAAAIVVAAIERGLTLENAVEQLICAAGGKACEDNATALVVCFDDLNPRTGRNLSSQQ